MRVVFMSAGARELALRSLINSDEVEVIGVVTPHPTEKNKRFSRVIDIASQYDIPVFYTRKDDIELTLVNLEYDLLISCGYSFKIPASVINKPKYAINVHPTLLPKYRGFCSGAYVVMNGEVETGVTIHFLSDKIDQGDIIIQKAFCVSKFDTPKSLFRKCCELEPNLLKEAIRLIRDDDFQAVKQDESQASVFIKNRKPIDSRINPKKTLLELYDDIRACDPCDYPAFFYVDGEKVCVKMWRPNKNPEEKDMV